MNIAIVFYSMSENTAFVADKVKEELLANNNPNGDINVDVIRIEPVKAFPSDGAKKFIWGGKSAVMGDKPELKPYTFEASKYDRIIIGTPVWAGTMAPPVRTFIEENKEALSGKQIGIYVCSAGDKGMKAVEKIKKVLGVDKLRFAMALTDPKNKPTEANAKEIERFCKNMV